MDAQQLAAAQQRTLARKRLRAAARYGLINPHEEADLALLEEDTPEREVDDFELLQA